MRSVSVTPLGVALSDLCWVIVMTKQRLWEFLERLGFRRGPVEPRGEMELLCLLTSTLIALLCFTTEGYRQYTQLQSGFESRVSEGQYLIR